MMHRTLFFKFLASFLFLFLFLSVITGANNLELDSEQTNDEGFLGPEIVQPLYEHFPPKNDDVEEITEATKFHDSTITNDVSGPKLSSQVIEGDPSIAFEEIDHDLGKKLLRGDKDMFPFLTSIRGKIAPFLPGPLSEVFLSIDGIIFQYTSVPEGSMLLFGILCFIFITMMVMRMFWGEGGIVFGRRNADSILLIGPSGSGKTAIFHKICHGVFPETVTSMKENAGVYSVAEGKSVKVVDIPGHQRLQILIKDYLPAALGIIFVVDAADVTSQIRPAAEMLYDILTDPILETGPTMLVVCNKTDAANAKTSARIRALLTKELDQLRKTRNTLSSDLNGDGRDVKFVPLGRHNHPLDLDQDSPCEITFVDASVKNNSLGNIEHFFDDFM